MTDEKPVLAWTVNRKGVHRAGRYRIAMDHQLSLIHI